MKKKRFKKLILIFIVILLIIGGIAAFIFMFNEAPSNETVNNDEPIVSLQEPVEITISAVGDIMMHMPQITAARNRDGSYDFNNNFKYVRSIFEESDLSIGNLETTFGGPPYRGWPLFSAPAALAPALKNANFDVIVTVNNHSVDRGRTGLLRTIEVLENYDLIVSGTRADDNQPRYAMFETQGVKIAIVAYTYASTFSNGDLNINGIRAQDSRHLLNYFRYTHLDTDLPNVEETINDARESGADIVIVFYHWGNEYVLQSNHYQRRIARRTVDMGADMIFGSHPHVLQEAVYLTNEETGRDVPVFYSLGNFISNQRYETLNHFTPNARHTEIGAIAQVRVAFDMNEREIKEIEKSAIPTWVERQRSGGNWVYTIIPLDENLESNSILRASGNLARAQRALTSAISTLAINGS